MYRPVRVPPTSRFLNPYIVCFIVVAVVVILAVTIALLVHFLAFDQKSYFYHSNFQILNVNYSKQLTSPATQAYKTLCGRIESVKLLEVHALRTSVGQSEDTDIHNEVLPSMQRGLPMFQLCIQVNKGKQTERITESFRESNLRNQFIRAYVAKLRQEGSDVIADIVMKFRFTRSYRRAALQSRIEPVLYKALNNFGNLEVNPSTDLTSITVQDAANIFTSACGAGPDLMTLSEERIIGGTKAEEGDWPWQVSLQRNNMHVCGGSLISNTWILTAAHCFRSSSNPRQWIVAFGISTISPTMRIRVMRIVIHANYDTSTRENDIALMQLDRRVTFTRNIHTVCLPLATQNILPGSTAYVTGWGSQEYGGNTVTELEQVRVRIISNNVCNAPTSYNGAILPGMLCAGLPSGGADACQGDSGGPLVQEDSRRLWFLVGIVSWGFQCGLPDRPGVYTRVTSYRNWINQQTGI